MTLRLLPIANSELQEAAHWYDGQQLGLGGEFLGAVSRMFSSIEASPDSFSRLETVDTSRNVRKAVLSRFPYVVVYEHVNDDIFVVAIVHAGRRPKFWIDRI